MNAKKSFSPLLFLASLGAGGVAIMPFVLLQYTHAHKDMLVSISDIGYGALSFWEGMYFRGLEGIMGVFSLIHVVMTVVLLIKLFKWLKTKDYKTLMQNPLKNSVIVAPFISILMTMNIMIGPIRYFISFFQENFQSMMLPAFIFWAILFIWLMIVVVRLLKRAFEKEFDVSDMDFGWLLQSFALGMMSVVGSGIAAMAHNANIAHSVAFLVSISGGMGFFLLVVKMVTLFKSQFGKQGLPEKQFLPSFLIVIPNITLYAISAFRLGHYMEHHQAVTHEVLAPFYIVIMTFSFAFEVWYMIFGLSLLKTYFKTHFFKKEFYVSQWGFICPIVAFGVLGGFVHQLFVPSIILYVVILFSILVAVVIYFLLLYRQLKCSCVTCNNKDHTCL